MEQYLEYARGLIETGNKIFNVCAAYNQQAQVIEGGTTITREEKDVTLALFARERDAELARLCPVEFDSAFRDVTIAVRREREALEPVLDVPVELETPIDGLVRR